MSFVSSNIYWYANSMLLNIGNCKGNSAMDILDTDPFIEMIRFFTYREESSIPAFFPALLILFLNLELHFIFPYFTFLGIFHLTSTFFKLQSSFSRHFILRQVNLKNGKSSHCHVRQTNSFPTFLVIEFGVIFRKAVRTVCNNLKLIPSDLNSHDH